MQDFIHGFESSAFSPALRAISLVLSTLVVGVILFETALTAAGVVA